MSPRNNSSNSRSDEFEEISDLKSDITDFKRYLVQLLVGALVAAVGYGVWVGTIQNTVSNLVSEFIDIKKTQRELEIKSATSNVRLETLETHAEDVSKKK